MMNPRRLNLRHLCQSPESEPEQIEPARASNGQVLVMFALFLTGLISMLGMATDLGYAFSQRRASQNAADAAALAGARMVVEKQAAWTEAANAATGNEMTDTTITMSSCTYVHQNADSSVTDLGTSCSAAPPATANGVRAEVTETHNTFFMQVLSINTVTTSANATANVQELKNVPGNGPFIVCGVKTEQVSGPDIDLLIKNAAGNWVLNPAADGHEFVIHGSKVEDCDAGSEFKGLTPTDDSNVGKDLGDMWDAYNGNNVGPVREWVRGPGGCKVGELVECVMILPIFIDTPKPDDSDLDGDGNKFQMTAIAYGAFYAKEGKTGGVAHSGTLLYDYSIQGEGTPGSWTPGSTKLITIRLTE